MRKGRHNGRTSAPAKALNRALSPRPLTSSPVLDMCDVKVAATLLKCLSHRGHCRVRWVRAYGTGNSAGEHPLSHPGWSIGFSVVPRHIAQSMHGNIAARRCGVNVVIRARFDRCCEAPWPAEHSTKCLATSLPASGQLYSESSRRSLGSTTRLYIPMLYQWAG